MTEALEKTDILIAGGGLAGASLALLLCRYTDFSVTLVEAAPFAKPSNDPLTPSFDARKLALAASSLATFEQLGLLPQLLAQSADILEVDVSTKGHLGQVRLTSAEMQVPRLGAVIESRRLGRLLLDSVFAEPRIRVLAPERVEQLTRRTDGYEVRLKGGANWHCRLLVVAEGAQSTTRDLLGIAAHHQDTGEAALVLNVAVETAPDGVAFERFLPTGPLAFLPLPEQRLAVVWAGKQAEVQRLAALDDAAFLAALQTEAEPLGIHIASLGQRAHYPLVTSHSAAQAIPHAVVVGNAAHALHPVAAQGFNLSLRDLDTLAQTLAGASDPGELALLEQYVAARQSDQVSVGLASSGLLSLFRVQFAPFAHARQLGMMAFSLLPGLRRSFTRRAMGLSR